MTSVVTFSRKNHRADGEGSSSASSAASTYVTAPSMLTPMPEIPGLEEEENTNAAATSTAKMGGMEQLPAARWRRKNAAERQAAERRQHLAEMRAFFEEVDAFELAVETPPAAKPRGKDHSADGHATPQQRGGRQQAGAAHALEAAAPTTGTAMRQRAMSLGLSRRRSSMVAWPMHTAMASSTKASQSQLKLSVPAGSLHEQQQGGKAVGGSALLPSPLGAHRLSVAGDNSALMGSPGGAGWAVSRHSLAIRGRHSSMAASRLSGTGKMLSRLSVGLTDALQWLGIKGRIPTVAGAPDTAGEEAGTAAAADYGGSAGLPNRPALSPIASPGVDGEGSTLADDSPLPASMAVTALEQQVDGAATLGSPVGLATAEQATAAAEEQHVPAPTPVPAEAPLEVVEAEAGAELSLATTEQADVATVEQLEEQLATKLQLQQAVEEEEVAVAQTPTAEKQQRLATESEAAAEEEEELTPLQQLLALCGQETDPELLPSMDDLLGQHVDMKKVRKIGEGTFGEAFKAGGVVLKIVPMEGSILINGEPQKRAEEILAEVSVTLTLSRLNGAMAAPGELLDNVTSGFVETFGVGVCRGMYSEALRREWHRWDRENESENESVDCFEEQEDQLFVVFVVADGGVDLEHFELRTFEEVRSVLLQTALTVAVGEEACEFEHRDLHWGNLLIRRSKAPAATAAVAARLRGVDLEATTGGVTVCLIDFTLSRLVTVTGEVAFCDLAADPELFKGPRSSSQAETYRRMKKATRNAWKSYVPATNVFWMQYLVDTCIAEKKGWGCRKEDLVELRAFKRRLSGYASCTEALFDDFLRPRLLIRD